MISVDEIRQEQENESHDDEIYFIDVQPGQQVVNLPTGVRRWALRFTCPVTAAYVTGLVPGAAQPGDMLVFGRYDPSPSAWENRAKVIGKTRFRVTGKVEKFSEPERWGGWRDEE